MSRVNHLSSLSLLAVLVLAGCSSQAPQPLKKGEKAIDVASVCNQVNHLIPTRVLVKGGEITCKILK